MDITRLVEQWTRNPNTLTTYNLLSRIRESSLDEARLMFEKHPKLRDFKDESGKTLLHFAAKCGNEFMTRYFIRGGCQVNVTDQLGNTPLILAAKSRNLSVVYKLLEANATNVLVANDLGESAAKIIIQDLKCNSVVFMTLLMKRVKEECGNDSLSTARKLLEMRCRLTQAVCSRDTIITEYMLKNGCSANERSDDDEGLTPLHQAVRLTDLGNVELLLNYGADVDAVMKKTRERPVHQMRWLEEESDDVFKALLKRCCDLTDDDGKLSVGQRLHLDDKETVSLMLQCLPDLNAKDLWRCPLLRYLAGNKHFDPVEELKGRTLDVNAVNKDGSTALMAAVYQNNLRTAEWLLKNGAPVDTVNQLGRRALDFVFYNCEFSKMKNRLEPRFKGIELLLKYGADVQRIDKSGLNIFLCAVVFKQGLQLMKPILAHLAVTEALGGRIKDFVYRKIQSNRFMRSYFVFCQRAILLMKRAKVRGSMTMFDFLVASERDVMKLVRSEKMVSRLKVMIFVKMRRSKVWYCRDLRRRLAKIVEMASLRSKALGFVSRIEGLCGNEDVAEKIVDYFNYDDLMIIALV